MGHGQSKKYLSLSKVYVPKEVFQLIVWHLEDRRTPKQPSQQVHCIDSVYGESVAFNRIIRACKAHSWQGKRSR